MSLLAYMPTTTSQNSADLVLLCEPQRSYCSSRRPLRTRTLPLPTPASGSGEIADAPCAAAAAATAELSQHSQPSQRARLGALAARIVHLLAAVAAACGLWGRGREDVRGRARRSRGAAAVEVHDREQPGRGFAAQLARGVCQLFCVRTTLHPAFACGVPTFLCWG